MKRILPAALAFSLITSPALAFEKYFSLSSGVFSPGKTSALNINGNQVNTSYDTGWSAGAAYGVAFDGPLRLETELVYRQAPSNGADDMWNLAWMINAWLELRNRSGITPYAGGGFGFGRGHNASPGPVDNSGTGVAPTRLGAGSTSGSTQNCLLTSVIAISGSVSSRRTQSILSIQTGRA